MARAKDTSGSRTDHALQSKGAGAPATSEPLKSIATPHHLYTASNLREWMEMAMRGEITGIVIGALDKDMNPIFGTAGMLHHKPREAHWVASVLADELLKRSLK